MRTRMFLAVLLPLCLAAPFDDIANHDHSDASQVKFNQKLRLLFKIMDIDQNRLIDSEELMLICLENDIDIPADEAERIVTLPGFLTMDKFVELLADCPSDKTADILLYLVHAGGNGDRKERILGFFNTWKSQFMDQITQTKNKLFGQPQSTLAPKPTAAPTTPVTSAPTTPVTSAPTTPVTSAPTTPVTSASTTSVTAVPCSGGATSLSTSPGLDMVLCQDKTQQTCEKDFESLCPAGWNLCTPGQFNNRNHGWDYNWVKAKAGYPFGVIYCYGSNGKAAHYAIRSSNPVLSTDQQLSCGWTSSRPGCEFFAGFWDCDNKEASALCCAPTRTCGDGEVQLEEDCDDGNKDNMDDCLNTCTWKNPGKHGLSGLGLCG